RAAGAAVGVEKRVQPRGADERDVDILEDRLAVPGLGVAAFAQVAEAVPGGAAESSRREKRSYFEALRGAENTAVGAEQLQAVPLRRVVAGGDLDRAAGLQPAHSQ